MSEQKRVPGYKAKGQKYKSILVKQYILKHADDCEIPDRDWLRQ